MIKAVIFDVDGVLVDSLEANFEYFKELFESAGYVAPTLEEYQHMFHIAVEDLVRLVAKNPDPQEFQRILDIEKTIKYPIEKMKLTEGSVEVVKKLSEKYRLAIVTGRHEDGAEDYLKHSGLEKYFETVVHYGHYENPKPHPEPLLIALERLGIDPLEAVYVGDQKTDLQSAKAAGISFILHSQYDYGLGDIPWKAANFRELPNLLEKMENIMASNHC